MLTATELAGVACGLKSHLNQLPDRFRLRRYALIEAKVSDLLHLLFRQADKLFYGVGHRF